MGKSRPALGVDAPAARSSLTGPARSRLPCCAVLRRPARARLVAASNHRPGPQLPQPTAPEADFIRRVVSALCFVQLPSFLSLHTLSLPGRSRVRALRVYSQFASATASARARTYSHINPRISAVQPRADVSLLPTARPSVSLSNPPRCAASRRQYTHPRTPFYAHPALLYPAPTIGYHA
ncbi:hypothetical protein Purlil1_10901 [Purpureocillium lilacinum]|uniref:Uncharacterized protein n=1 Tax=Purpureocillium lilacinum TaxID=33203 RepID=A0ABR0BLB7_PURLI|nr:hypothetical protein Purlil1_10901 [Purpureocillium lilacinum]